MKYSQQIGIVAVLAIIGICFLPWVTVELPQGLLTLNGIHTKVIDKEGKLIGSFGRPIIPHAFFGGLLILFFSIQKVWAKRINIFIAFFHMGWAIREYILFSICRPECPTVKPALYLLVFFSAVILIMSFLPKMRVK